MTRAVRLPSGALRRLARVLCGDWPPDQAQPSSPYRTHQQVADFFAFDVGIDLHSFDEQYGFGSRMDWTLTVLSHFNGKPELVRIIDAAVDPAHFLSTDSGPDAAIEYLNVAFVSSGWTLEPCGGTFRLLYDVEGDLAVRAPNIDRLNRDYVYELSDKCERRLRDGDYDGAVTAARTLLESVLVEVEQRITGRRRDHERDLQGQFTVIHKLLHIDEERSDLDAYFKTISKALVQVVNSLAPLRNKLGDGHARERMPAPHHARLVVNAAKTVAFFLAETYACQQDTSTLGDARSQETSP